MSSFWDVSFLVRPLEAVHFGPPKSFVAGEAHHSRSVFPPTATTFQGLLRSRLLAAVHPPLDLSERSAAASSHWEQLVGPSDSLPPGWQIEGPFPAEIGAMPGLFGEEEETVIPWTPTPRFLLSAGKDKVPLHARIIRSTHPGRNDLKRDILPVGRPEFSTVEPLGGWVDPENLAFALTGEGKRVWSCKGYGKEALPFVEYERHPGVAIDRGEKTIAEPGGVSSRGRGEIREDRGAAAHGMLYFLETLRFAPSAGLFGLFSGAVSGEIPRNALTTGVGVVGKHSRYVAFEPARSLHPTWQGLRQGDHLTGATENEEQLFWLVAMAPARLSSPLDPMPRIDLPIGLRVTFRAALTGYPLAIGGYRAATGDSRPTRPYVPAGSCWLLQVQGGDPKARESVLRQMHNRHVLGPADEARFGYGLTFIGIGPREERKQA